jgi:hemerythrin
MEASINGSNSKRLKSAVAGLEGNMLYIVWNDKNSLGIPIIDEQHRGIVSTINTLHYFVKNGQGNEALSPTLSILEQYTKIHFRIEEALMINAGYPGYHEHVLLHKGLMKKTLAIAQGSKLLKDADAVLNFLKNWWLGHINGEDKKYGQL